MLINTSIQRCEDVVLNFLRGHLKSAYLVKSYFFNPLSPVSHFVIFSPTPSPLFYSLNSGELWRETEDIFLYMAAEAYHIISKEVKKCQKLQF